MIALLANLYSYKAIDIFVYSRRVFSYRIALLLLLYHIYIIYLYVYIVEVALILLSGPV